MDRSARPRSEGRHAHRSVLGPARSRSRGWSFAPAGSGSLPAGRVDLELTPAPDGATRSPGHRQPRRVLRACGRVPGRRRRASGRAAARPHGATSAATCRAKPTSARSPHAGHLCRPTTTTASRHLQQPDRWSGRPPTGSSRTGPRTQQQRVAGTRRRAAGPSAGTDRRAGVPAGQPAQRPPPARPGRRARRRRPRARTWCAGRPCTTTTTPATGEQTGVGDASGAGGAHHLSSGRRPGRRRSGRRSTASGRSERPHDLRDRCERPLPERAAPAVQAARRRRCVRRQQREEDHQEDHQAGQQEAIRTSTTRAVPSSTRTGAGTGRSTGCSTGAARPSGRGRRRAPGRAGRPVVVHTAGRPSRPSRADARGQHPRQPLPVPVPAPRRPRRTGPAPVRRPPPRRPVLRRSRPCAARRPVLLARLLRRSTTEGGGRHVAGSGRRDRPVDGRAAVHRRRRTGPAGRGRLHSGQRPVRRSTSRARRRAVPPVSCAESGRLHGHQGEAPPDAERQPTSTTEAASARPG